jgi:hypothetical protein
MSQSAKHGTTQANERRGWAGALHSDAAGLTEAAIRRAGFPSPSLVFRWGDIAGQETARVARPIRCRSSTAGLVLTLRCEPAASVFLQHETRSLLERLNAFLGPGTITRIQVIPGPLAESSALPGRAARPVPKSAEPKSDSPLKNALSQLDILRRHKVRDGAKSGQ